MKFKRFISMTLCVIFTMTVIMLALAVSGCESATKDKSGSGTSENGTSVEDGGASNTVDSASAEADNTSAATNNASAANSGSPAGEPADSGGAGGKQEDARYSLSAPVFTDSITEKYIETEYKPLEYIRKVKPYQVKENLSNIENLEQFGSFSAAQKKLLSQNGFFTAPSDEEQLFYIYERNAYLKLPSFITVDSVLQVYHIFFDYSLRTLESKKLIEALEQLTDDMLNKSIIIYNGLENGKVRKEALANIAYFAVSQLALEKELPANIPEEAKQLAEKEFELITAEQGFDNSPIFGYQLDYSQYKPRGHYTRSPELERYFRSMMWYGQAPFAIYKEVDGQKVLNKEMVTRAILMTYTLFSDYRGRSDARLWETIYNTTCFYVGSTDDLNIFDFKELILKVYGNEIDLNELMADDKMEALFREAEKLPEPQIRAEWTTVNTPSGKQFRFMGQRYIADSEILQKLVEPYLRPMPSGLDVMAVLGSDRAHDILVNDHKVELQWPGYSSEFKKLKEKFTEIPDTKWRSNMYYGWLWTLKSLITPFGQGYPSFMTSSAWKDKSLNTALGSWAELRHDTILYGKQSGAEGGSDIPPVVKSYVEPNIELYEKLLWLTRYSRDNLTQMEILPEELQRRMENFEELLDFLITCSVSELKNEELSEEDYCRLLEYGGTLEYLTSSLADEGLRWFEITSDTDKNMASIADVHTVASNYLEAGVGHADQIFVVVPIGGKLYLTRGAVFSYYEFVSSQRLTDEEWQKMLKEGKQPEQPGWMESFKGGEKAEIPVPSEPYNVHW